MELTNQIWWIYPENVGRSEGHPAPFPEALPNRLINMYTFPSVDDIGFPGDIVLDPFAGWGTTCVAAKRLGRRFMGVDLSPAFCNHSILRLARTSRSEKPIIMTAERPSKTDRRQVFLE
jgi:DNA modification methylase